MTSKKTSLNCDRLTFRYHDIGCKSYILFKLIQHFIRKEILDSLEVRLTLKGPWLGVLIFK